ncbi:type II toxin-antitoxin system VapC family toxin [Imperialibacter roseus]|uniref:Type II toxin-antitoxin system VapC family toxin n=1 Tax=Imperialibacter roseus TaxID=1324217 RepID=A0ABZ0ISX6_9BACT|nr:type II toxin-antitoxin system VapC family toxin [Imperialibacter roseus]WOK08089.1 type II toxin-antitoxin system VapC family toxin [Imperialibacter roseus]
MEKEQLVLCDTNIIIEFYKENATILEALKQIGQENIVLSIVSSGELMYGALNKKELNKINQDLFHLKVLDIDKPTCEMFMKLMNKYSLSHNLTLGDGLIAATAIAHGLPLYTLNLKDFKYIEGVRLWIT